jgi:branched-subunit amino acid aminotransferase/4-amino-4-deoxychorismate lyase
VTPSVRDLPAACVDPHIKQRSRLHWWLAEQEVRRASPHAQALLLDTDEFVTETASSNFLLVKDGTILSPPFENVLEGVSLKVVGELCARLGIAVVERPLTLQDCYKAEEALLTCTTFCLAGVKQINGRWCSGSSRHGARMWGLISIGRSWNPFSVRRAPCER